MTELVENDIPFALPPYHVPELFHFMFYSDDGGVITASQAER